MGRREARGGLIRNAMARACRQARALAFAPSPRRPRDRVLFGKWSGTEVKIDREDLLIMKESDVMGVIEGASAPKTKAA